MAMEQPIVSTTIGAEGLPVRDGVELLLADEPRAFADAVVRVLHDAELALRIGQQAAVTVRTRFGWGNVADEFAALCEKALQSASRKVAVAGAKLAAAG